MRSPIVRSFIGNYLPAFGILKRLRGFCYELNNDKKDEQLRLDEKNNVEDPLLDQLESQRLASYSAQAGAAAE